MKNTRFYVCPHCRNTAEMIYDTDIRLFCCGDEMEELRPATAGTGGEKHTPTVTLGHGTVDVSVGSVAHPMENAHRIEWVQLVTDRGSQRKFLKPGEAPRVRFLLCDEIPLEVYAYCNLHGLWKTRLN